MHSYMIKQIEDIVLPIRRRRNGGIYMKDKYNETEVRKFCAEILAFLMCGLPGLLSKYKKRYFNIDSDLLDIIIIAANLFSVIFGIILFIYGSKPNRYEPFHDEDSVRFRKKFIKIKNVSNVVFAVAVIGVLIYMIYIFLLLKIR